MRVRDTGIFNYTFQSQLIYYYDLPLYQGLKHGQASFPKEHPRQADRAIVLQTDSWRLWDGERRCSVHTKMAYLMQPPRTETMKLSYSIAKLAVIIHPVFQI